MKSFPDPRKASFVTRRQLLQTGGTLGLVAGTDAVMPRSTAATVKTGSDIYQSIGVRPILNCKGTFTIISGSLTLPEVKQAMNEAGRHYVQMDELMTGVGQRLAELTGAPWGIVTAGCAAAMTHLTSASLAGTDPERMQQLPNLSGLKSEVVIPSYSRNEYDHAIRMLGVKVIEVSDSAQLESAFTERTTMAYVLAGRGDDGPLGTRVVAEIAQRHKVPLVVDAAAENLTIPNIHLQRGASVVLYSGGKCLRGPQCAGLALGDKNLLEAAWANSAPHHAFGRSLKVGKEEIIGMLTAVEMWTRRDHKAEWAQWESWLDTIAIRVTKVPGVTTRIAQPESLSNHAPTLMIEWDGDRLGVTGTELSKHLLDTEPRIILAGGRGNRPVVMRSFVGVMPYMMQPGDAEIAADRLFATLSNPPKPEVALPTSGGPANISGRWDTLVEYKRGNAAHVLTFEQSADRVTGTHQGEILTGDLAGSVSGNEFYVTANHRIEGTTLHFRFQGKVEDNNMTGTVDLGEYGFAKFTAQRHAYGSNRRDA